MKRNLLVTSFWVGLLCLIFWFSGVETLEVIAGVVFSIAVFFALLFSIVWVIKKAWKS